MFTVIDGAALRIDDRLRVAKERREEADKQQGKTVIPVTIFKVALLNTEGCILFESKKSLDFSLKISIVLELFGHQYRQYDPWHYIGMLSMFFLLIRALLLKAVCMHNKTTYQ